MINEQEIYKYIKKVIQMPASVTNESVALDLLSLVGCQNVSLIQAVIDGCEKRERAVDYLDELIEAYAP
jgi:hypothetical protein